jgi:beta-phosphoglucomutase
MRGIGAVIFDFNGVLVDDESVHFALFREVLGQEGVAITERDYHERYLGYDDRKCFESALVDAGKNADRERLGQLIAEKARRYVEVAKQGLRFFPAAARTLNVIAIKWPVAICSGALRREIEDALRQLGCRDQVVAIVSAEDTEKCKPDPTSYILALEALRECTQNGHSLKNARNEGAQLDLEAVNCLVVEDSLAGIAAAKRAGMHAVGVPHTYTSDQLGEAGADAVIDELATLTPEWIEWRFSSWHVPRIS